MTAFLKFVDYWLQLFLRWLCILLFAALGLILAANVTMRVLNDASRFLASHGLDGPAAAVKSLAFITSMHWFDEIVELCFASLVFYGAASLWGRKGHFRVGDWISSRLPCRSLQAIYRLIVTLLSISFLAIFLWYSLALSLHTPELSTVFQIPKTWIYSCMPASAAIMLGYSLADAWLDVGMLFSGGPGGGERTHQSL